MTVPISGTTRVAAVIGDPIAHSRSPAIWNAAFRVAQVDWVFVAFAVPAGGAAAALAGARALGIAGLAVTMPHKADAAAACDHLTPTAEALCSVNAIVNREGQLEGDSTDGQGFLRAVRDEGVDVAGRRCVVLGAGGAARAIAHALGGIGAHVTVAARRPDAAAATAGLAPGGHGIALANVETELARADLLVNATPLGMRGEAPLVDVARLPSGAVVVDSVYSPAETPLLAAARARGIACIAGIGMLVHQAALSFEWFTGEPAPLDAMRAAATA